MPTKRGSSSDMMDKLAETNVELQKMNVSLLESVNDLTKRIDKLISLFEEASKHVGEVGSEDERIKMLAIKLEDLLEQNKTIAKGLLMLERYVRSKTSGFSKTEF